MRPFRQQRFYTFKRLFRTLIEYCISWTREMHWKLIGGRDNLKNQIRQIARLPLKASIPCLCVCARAHKIVSKNASLAQYEVSSSAWLALVMSRMGRELGRSDEWERHARDNDCDLAALFTLLVIIVCFQNIFFFLLVCSSPGQIVPLSK